MEKYWNDTELMSKISAKLEAMNIGPTAAVNSKVPSGHKVRSQQHVVSHVCSHVNLRVGDYVLAVGFDCWFDRCHVLSCFS